MAVGGDKDLLLADIDEQAVEKEHADLTADSGSIQTDQQRHKDRALHQSDLVELIEVIPAHHPRRTDAQRRNGDEQAAHQSD